jgi:hypothetical protein
MTGKRYTIFVLPAIGILFTLLIWPALVAPFTMEDEHYYPWLYRGFHNLNSIHEQWNHWTAFYQSWVLQGRFHPIYTLLVYVKGVLFGSSPHAIHATVWLASILCGWGLYKWLRALDMSPISAFFGVASYALGEWYSEIFLRLNTGESIGNLFLVWSLFFLTLHFRKKSSSLWPGLLLGLMAAGCKESYVLLFPTLLVYAWVCAEKPEKPMNWLSTHKRFLFGMIGFSLLLGLGLMNSVLSSGKVFNYGNKVPTWLLLLENMGWMSKGFYMIILILLVTILHSGLKALPAGLLLWAFCLLVTQLFAYHNLAITYSQGRFIMPAGLAFVLVGAVLVEHFLFQHPRWLGIALCTILSFWMVRNAKILYVNSAAFAARATAFDGLVNHLSKNCDRTMVILGGIEFPYSLQTQLMEKGCKARFLCARDSSDEGINSANRAFIEYNWKQIQRDFKTTALYGTAQIKGSLLLVSDLNPRAEKIAWLTRRFGPPQTITARYPLLSWSDLLRWLTQRQELPCGEENYYIFRP